MKKKSTTKVKNTKTKAVKKASVKKVVASKKKITVAKAVTQKKKFSISLTLDNETLNVKGDSIMACLDQLSPSMFKSKAVFVVSSGALKSERVMKPFELKRLLSGTVSKVCFEKRMLAVLK